MKEVEGLGRLLGVAVSGCAPVGLGKWMWGEVSGVKVGKTSKVNRCTQGNEEKRAGQNFARSPPTRGQANAAQTAAPSLWWWWGVVNMTVA